MSDSITETYRKLIEQYETKKAEDPVNAEDLLTGLLEDLYEESSSYWYNSNC